LAGALEDHANVEQKYIIEAFATKFPNEAKQWSSDHKNLDQGLHEMLALAKKIVSHDNEKERVAFGNRLYKDWNTYLANYFLHLREEEEVLLPLIHSNFTAEEVLMMEVKSIRDFPADDLAQKLPVLFTVLNPDERLFFYKHVQKHVEPDTAKKLEHNIKQLLTAEEWKTFTSLE